MKSEDARISFNVRKLDKNNPWTTGVLTVYGYLKIIKLYKNIDHIRKNKKVKLKEILKDFIDELSLLQKL